MDLKLNIIPFESAEASVDDYMNEIKHLKESFLNVVDENKLDYSIREEFRQLGKNIIESKIINEIKRL